MQCDGITANDKINLLQYYILDKKFISLPSLSSTLFVFRYFYFSGDIGINHLLFKIIISLKCKL